MATIWVVLGIVALGSFTLLLAKIKAGKTTFILDLCRAVLAGMDFFGQPTSKRPVVYLTEQSGPSFKAQLTKAGLLGHPDFIYLPWNRVASMAWQSVTRGAIYEAHLQKDALLVIDTLQQFAGIEGDGENSAGETLRAMKELQIGAGVVGLPIIVVHHERKGGGAISDAGRGSSAMGGTVDTLLVLRKPSGNYGPNVRVLEGVSRNGEIAPELFVELTDHGFVVQGSERDFTKQNAHAYLMEKAPADPGGAVTFDDLLKESGFKKTTMKEAVNDMVERGDMNQIGKGVKADPRRYYLA